VIRPAKHDASAKTASHFWTSGLAHSEARPALPVGVTHDSEPDIVPGPMSAEQRVLLSEEVVDRRAGTD
jgi:hypothetical protein